MLNSTYNLNTLIINVLLVLSVVLIGGILPLYERKFLSLTQRRVGPKYVGYKGRLQFVADALKVLWKEFILLYQTNPFYFFFLPIVYLNLNLLFFINIYWFSNASLFGIEYNLIFFILLDILLHVFMIFVGFFLKNKYTTIASTRLINISFSFELFILMIHSLFLVVLKSFSFQKVLVVKGYLLLFFLFFFFIPFIIIFFLIETGKTPFDIVEAETEVIMGYHVEYSGFLFGLYVLSEYFHVLVGLYLVSLFIL